MYYPLILIFPDLGEDKKIDEVYYLQMYEEGWNSGKWRERMDIRPCTQETYFKQVKIPPLCLTEHYLMLISYILSSSFIGNYSVRIINTVNSSATKSWPIEILIDHNHNNTNPSLSPKYNFCHVMILRLQAKYQNRQLTI